MSIIMSIIIVVFVRIIIMDDLVVVVMDEVNTTVGNQRCESVMGGDEGARKGGHPQGEGYGGVISVIK